MPWQDDRSSPPCTNTVGLAKKRAMLGMNSPPTLSQLLQEAKARSAEGGEGDTTLETISYSRFFEEYHGVVHLEALELLSKECTAKVSSLMRECYCAALLSCVL